MVNENCKFSSEQVKRHGVSSKTFETCDQRTIDRLLKISRIEAGNSFAPGVARFHREHHKLAAGTTRNKKERDAACIDEIARTRNRSYDFCGDSTTASPRLARFTTLAMENFQRRSTDRPSGTHHPWPRYSRCWPRVAKIYELHRRVTQLSDAIFHRHKSRRRRESSSDSTEGRY